MCLCLGVMEDLWKTVSFGGMVDDKKMQTGALWCGLSMGILFDGLAKTLRLNKKVNDTIN